MPPATTDEADEEQSWVPLIAISLAMFSVVLDSTMMNVAVGAIARDLNTNVTGAQAAMSLYSLVMASLMLAGGKLGPCGRTWLTQREHRTSGARDADARRTGLTSFRMRRSRQTCSRVIKRNRARRASQE